MSLPHRCASEQAEALHELRASLEHATTALVATETRAVREAARDEAAKELERTVRAALVTTRVASLSAFECLRVHLSEFECLPHQVRELVTTLEAQGEAAKEAAVSTAVAATRAALSAEHDALRAQLETSRSQLETTRSQLEEAEARASAAAARERAADERLTKLGAELSAAKELALKEAAARASEAERRVEHVRTEAERRQAQVLEHERRLERERADLHLIASDCI